MAEKGMNVSRDEEAASYDRRFKYAVIAFAVIEFIVIALTVYYKLAR